MSLCVSHIHCRNNQEYPQAALNEISDPHVVMRGLWISMVLGDPRTRDPMAHSRDFAFRVSPINHSIHTLPGSGRLPPMLLVTKERADRGRAVGISELPIMKQPHLVTRRASLPRALDIHGRKKDERTGNHLPWVVDCTGHGFNEDPCSLGSETQSIQSS